MEFVGSIHESIAQEPYIPLSHIYLRNDVGIVPYMALRMTGIERTRIARPYVTPRKFV